MNALHHWDEFAIIPHWNAHGTAQTGTFHDGRKERCLASYAGWLEYRNKCVQLEWSEGLFPYSPARQDGENWHGSLLNEKRDASGLLYRRNRYYDPATGRFTQEDPIGLAGGVNVYGFANGDPVTYSDPYGLCPPLPRCLMLAGGAAVADGPLPIGDLVAVGLLTIGAIHVLTSDNAATGTRVTPITVTQENRRRDENTVVRIQAQGGGLERSIVLQNPTAAEGLAALATLQASLTPAQREERAVSFAKAARFIENAPKGGGVIAPGKGFPNGARTSIRVDVEVKRGTAFRQE
jgi:RHS repeat-associated protein